MANKANAKKQAIAFMFPRKIEATNKLLVVPKSAPSMKGMAFFRLITLATAKGTNSPMVMLEENKIAVNKNPAK